MVFVAGPRQVGQTTLAKQFLSFPGNDSESGYLNWDIPSQRQQILQYQLLEEDTKAWELEL
jgi:hypothetical protein